MKISTGVSSVEITVPSSTAAKITSESLLSHLDAGDGFTKREGAFWTQAALTRTSPLLTIETAVALGMLKLRLTEQAPINLLERAAMESISCGFEDGAVFCFHSFSLRDFASHKDEPLEGGEEPYREGNRANDQDGGDDQQSAK